MAKGSNNIRGRSSDASRPYDVSNSFVKRMASRVTGLLPQPSSWFSRWTSTAPVPSTSDYVGHSLSSTITSRPPATSRAELNLVDNVDHHAPAAKKPRTNRYNSPVTQNKFLRNDGYSAEDISPIAIRGGEPVAGPSTRDTHPELIASTPAVPVQQISAKVNGDDCSETSESTSGCSSLVPQAQSSTRSLGGSRYGQSSFPIPSGASLDALDRRRPSFNTTTFNSPLRASMRNRLGSSPFYSGRTMYGGSSQACEYSRLVMEQSPQRRVGPTVRPPPSQQQSMPLSATAKRILDALEQFSTPVTEAKRMPVVGSKRKLETSVSGAATQRYTELSIPSTPDLLRVKRRERLQLSTLEARQTATQSTTFPPPATPAEYSIRKEDTDRKKHTGKVKTKEKVEEIPVEVILPPAVLAVDKLPKIDIAIPPPPQTLGTSSQSHTVTTDSKFVFSAPTFVTSVVTPVNIPTSTFKFSAPLGDTTISSNVSLSESKKHTVSSSAFSSRTSSDEVPRYLESKMSQDDSSLTLAYTKSPVGAQKTPTTLISNAVKSSNNTSLDCKYHKESASAGDKTVSTTQKWECSNCKNNNSSSLEVCISCQANKNSKLLDTSKNNIKTSVSSGFGNLYKKPIGNWECSVCLIQNKSEATKCIACESPKPAPKGTVDKKDSLTASKPDVKLSVSVEIPKADTKSSEFSKPEAASETKKSETGFGNLFKKPSGSWTCDVCMISNTAEKVKCAACETPKPGVTLPKSLEPSAPTFSFGIPAAVSASSGTGTTFSFGIPKGEQSISTLNSSLSITKTALSSDSPQTSTPTFSFGIPKTTKTESDNSNAVISSTTSKPTFQFGSGSLPGSLKETKPSFVSPPAASIVFGTSNPETSKAVEFKKPAFSIATTTTSTVATSNTGIKTARPVFGMNSEKSSSGPEKTSNTTPLFTFGTSKVTQNESEKSKDVDSTSKPTQPSIMFGTKQGGYGSSMPSSTTNTLSASSPSNVLKFGETKTVSSGGDVSSISSASTQGSLTTPKANSIFSFGSNTEKKEITFGATPEKESLSGTTSTPVTEIKPTFGSFGATSNVTAAFGNTSAFENNNFVGNKEQQLNPFVPKTTTNAFGATTTNTSSSTFSGFGQTNAFQPPAQENKISQVFTFGSSGQKETAPSGGFTFNPVGFQPNQTHQNTSGQLFGFNNTTATAQTPSTNFNFEPKSFGSNTPGISPFNAAPAGASAPVFGTQALQQGPAFGEQVTAAPLFNFGSQPAQQPQAPANPVFEFGSNQQVTPVAPAPAPATSFVFGAGSTAPSSTPAFDPNLKPTFNFTQGAAAPVFSAIPAVNSTGPAQPPTRKIRKAVRRTNISSVRQT